MTPFEAFAFWVGTLVLLFFFVILSLVGFLILKQMVKSAYFVYRVSRVTKGKATFKHYLKAWWQCTIDPPCAVEFKDGGKVYWDRRRRRK